MRYFFLITALWFIAASVTCASKVRGEVDLAAVQPYLDDAAVLVVRVDLTRLNVEQAATTASALFAGSPAAAKAQSGCERGAKIGKELLAAGAKQVFLVVRLSDVTPNGPSGLGIMPLSSGMDGDKLVAACKQCQIPWAESRNGAVIFGETNIANTPAERVSKPRSELVAALSNVEGLPIQIALAPTDNERRALTELLPLQSPQAIAALPMIQWTRTVALGIGLDKEVSLQVDIRARDEAAAKNLYAALSAMIPPALSDLAAHDKVDLRELADQWLEAHLEKDCIVMKTKAPLSVDLLRRNFEQPLAIMSERSALTDIAMNLHSIGISIHNFHDQHSSLPPAFSSDKEGKPLLSWRVLILPYIDDPKALYKEFHLDEPWNSPHNKTLIAKMPDIYRSPRSQAGAGKTVFLTPRGEASAFPGRAAQGFRDIADGTSMTIAVIEVDDEHAVEWTRPDDWNYDLQKPRQGVHPGVFAAMLLDASVRLFDDSLSDEQLRNMITRAGGETVQLP